ncbi:MazG nucleotide pyrophosphohydrolase domain-containing protein [Bacillus sp. 31A1R]|uniref:MazG nucleotide pyrophosphohydrolase domain-containing protein n=1 Tax=Robertmurraya mangrovi TaxID=3098077 RepID=A0ABU5J3T6_9BACI|nr:MazG nucleotide pyrophosphohydrolase domain-containing protein [Bacillus sp. 31A1R]MDZ5474095.1 MazG nucleotide pyrophosphohydrolase domain-containing protein [Bacillus sp. 31A1R]
MKEMQEFLKSYHKEMNWEIDRDGYESARASLLNNYMLLTTEVSEVAEELRKLFNLTNNNIKQGIDAEESFSQAKETVREDLGKEFADCLAYIIKIANYFEIDLEESFYEKMEEVKNRKNKDIRLK